MSQSAATQAANQLFTALSDCIEQAPYDAQEALSDALDQFTVLHGESHARCLLRSALMSEGMINAVEEGLMKFHLDRESKVA